MQAFMIELIILSGLPRPDVHMHARLLKMTKPTYYENYVSCPLTIHHMPVI
jgi:hypothetical protein